VSGLCPIPGRTEYVSPAQYAAYDAQKHINRRSKVISPASHAEGRWFDPSRDHLRKSITDQIEQQWTARQKAISDMLERQWDVQKKVIEEAQNRLGGMFRPDPKT
jgi:hypothetical protein